MNQYIIDEEQRSKLAYLISCVESHFCSRHDRDEILDSICSHPYNPQAKQEKMLDELINYKLNFLCNYLLPHELSLKIKDYEKELRQSKDGE